jgi:hypothetical protein
VKFTQLLINVNFIENSRTGETVELPWAFQYHLPACSGAFTRTYLAELSRRKDKGIRRKTEGKMPDESLLVIR